MPRGVQFWEQLAAAIQREPLEDRDRFFMAMLRPWALRRPNLSSPMSGKRKF